MNRTIAMTRNNEDNELSLLVLDELILDGKFIYQRRNYL